MQEPLSIHETYDDALKERARLLAIQRRHKLTRCNYQIYHLVGALTENPKFTLVREVSDEES